MLGRLCYILHLWSQDSFREIRMSEGGMDVHIDAGDAGQFPGPFHVSLSFVSRRRRSVFSAPMTR